MTNDIVNILQKAISTNNLAHVKMYEPNPPAARIVVPQADDSFFYTGGRMLSYFPKVNENGMAFFRDDCKGLAQSLLASMADVQHEKPNYPDNPHNNNKSIGAICDVLEHEEGIDIACKIEREVAKGLGYTPEDFMPDKGQYGKFSQECDFKPLDTSWIVVDKSDPSKIVKEVGYLEGLVAGYRCSRVIDGKWQYYFDEGNPVYIRIRPTSFTGVGHVITPADSSAQIYNYSADNSTKQVLVSFFPGIDLPVNDVPADMLTNTDGSVMGNPGATGADQNWMAQDFQSHPDLITCSTVDKFATRDETDQDLPDDLFAACYMGSAVDANGRMVPTKLRQLRIKNNKGEMDRKRLISAYHALCGFRGDTHSVQNLPPAVRAHALALVRQGLNETKPKNSKEKINKSMSMTIEQELEALKLKEAELTKAMSANDKALADQKAEYEKALSAKDDLITSKDSEIANLTQKIKEYEEKALAATRLTELEKVLAFTEDEKKADTFESFIKNLASMSEDRFSTELLRRENARLQKEVAESKKAVASRMVGNPLGGNPIPGFTAPINEGGNDEKITLQNLY